MSPEARWRILITNLTLAEWTGTEAYVRDLAVGLLRRGHQPVVYSPRLGAAAEALRRASVPVVDDLDRIAAPPDLIHGHHNLTTLTALLHFPRAPAVFVCHGQVVWHDAPLLHPRVYRYVAVDENCRDRLLLEGGVPEEQVRLVLNWVDLERFRPRPALPAQARRALVFSNYVGERDLLALRAACDAARLGLDVLGAPAANATACPEQLLARYDLVFAKGRSALEALAVGAAVVLLGFERLGPLVTNSEFERLRRWNFGMRAIQGPITAEAALREIRRYDAADAQRVAERVRKEATLEAGLDALLGVYAEALRAQAQDAPPGADEERRATARFLAGLDVLAARLIDEAERLAVMGRELRRVAASGEPMPPLEVEDCKRLALDAVQAHAQVPAGAPLTVAVTVRNGSGRLVCSSPPHPVHLAHRWTPADGPTPDGCDGVRARLEPPLAPVSSGTYLVPVIAPARPGAYRLRITLVQEGVRWFESLGLAEHRHDTLVLVS